jgi:eukaryotic-like serine/threonine-protein kinase
MAPGSSGDEIVADNEIDRNLLFAVIALQNHFIDQADLIAAFHDWSADKSRSLDRVLAARGAITDQDLALVGVLVAKHLEKHGGNVRGTLGAVADAPARDAIRALDDPAVHQTLSSLPPAAGYVLVETLMPPTEARRSRYTLTHLHAQGGLGRVWLARDTDLNREVALKEILPGKAPHPDLWRRFLKEAQVTGQLEHPGIVPVYELARRSEDDQPFYTMRFVRGQTLRAAIADYHRRRTEARIDPLERPRLLQAFVSICQAIAYAHSRGVIHRDLKPDNVVLGGFGEVLVLDWGLAKRVDRPEDDAGPPSVAISDEAEHEATREGQYLGTPAYMAPEQAEGRLDLLDVRTDVYGLGAILFEILTGRTPHEGDSVMQILFRAANEPTPRTRAVEPSVPPALDAICSKAMARERSDRYASASDLAVDMQRWLADEPVSAFVEPWARRLARFARRHRHPLQVAAALLLTAVVSVVALVRIDRMQRINRLSLELEKGLESADWSAAGLKGLEEKATALERLDRAQGLDARRRVQQSFARALNDLMDRTPRLEPAVIGRLERDLATLESRSPELARALRQNLELRLSHLETTALAPPFREETLGAFLDPEQVDRDGNGLSRRHPPDDPSEPVLATRLDVPGDARLAVTFQQSWASAAAVGLTLEVGSGRRYQFLVGVPDAPWIDAGNSVPPATMASVRRAGGRLRLAILRDRAVLAERTIPAPDGPLRLEAGREGDVFSLQVNAERPLTFEDPFPLTEGARPVFGIYWPVGIGLQGLMLQRRLLPGRPSPLERGDGLYARGEFAAAIAAYREQEQQAALHAGPLAQQLNYKVALCLLKIGREDEAASQLGEVMAGIDTATPGEVAPWALRAACQLWLLRISEKKVEEADRILETLGPRFSFQQLAALVPAPDRDVILARYQKASIWGTVGYRTHDDLRDIRRALQVQDMLNADDHERQMTKWRLVDILRVSGDLEGALKELRQLLDDPGLPPDERVEVLRDFVWVRIEQGEVGAREALDRVNDRLAGDRLRPEDAPLLMERVRIAAALGHWDDADRDCERYFAEVPRDRLDYAEFADACLVRGFLRDRRGDRDGAAAAWGEGLLRRWPGGIPALSPYRRLDRVALRHRSDSVTLGVMLASLVGDLTEGETESMFDVMSGANTFERSQSDGGEIIRFMRKLGGITPMVRQIMLNQCRDPRDRDFARSLVFRRLSLSDYIVVPLEIGVVSAVRVGAFVDGIPPPLDPVVRDTVRGLFQSYESARLRDADLVIVVRLWLSLALVPSNLWDSLAPRLDPHLRAPLACAFGRRFVVLGRAKTAAPFFQDALEHTKQEEVLHRFASDELARLKAPPAVTRP